MRRGWLGLIAVALLGACAVPAGAADQILINGGRMDPGDFQAVGTAETLTGGTTLTAGGTEEAGAVWLKERVTSHSFRADFQFRVTPTIPFGVEASADGFTFAIGATTTELGGPYAGLGLAPSQVGGFAIEFDTWKNEFDPDGNHLGLDLNSSVQSLTTAPVPVAFDDGELHNAVVFYEATPDGGHVRVSVDGIVYLETTSPLVTVPDGYFGFTGSTGAGAARTRIENFRLVTAVPQSVAGGAVNAHGKVEANNGFAANLNIAVSVTRQGVPKGSFRIRFAGRPRRRLRLETVDAILVAADGTATVWGSTADGTLVRLDVQDLRQRDPIRLQVDRDQVYQHATLAKGKLVVKIPRNIR